MEKGNPETGSGIPQFLNSSISQLAPPTRVRHQILALTTSMAVLLYLDRVCISAAAPAIRDSFCLSKDAMGWVFSAFFIGYGLAQVPAGWLGDRLGTRRTLAAFVLAWSAWTALAGWASGLVTLLAARILLGVCQAGAYPIAGRINSLWTPFQSRALASSVITLGGRLGGAVAPWLTVVLIAALYDWRPAFWLYGWLGLLWTVWFWVGFRDQPGQHPHCNPAERALIEKSLPADAASPHGQARGLPWRAALSSRSLWLQNIMQFMANIAWVFLITWMPTYLIEQYHLDLEEAGRLASLPLFGSMAGSLLGGLVTDWLTRRIGLRWGRGLPGMLSRFLSGMGFVAGAWAGDPYLATAALVFAAFTSDLGLSAMWAYFQDTGGPFVGTFLAWANMFGNLGAAMGPKFVEYLARNPTLGWSGALAACAAIMIVSGLCWLGIDSRVPIVQQSKQA